MPLPKAFQSDWRPPSDDEDDSDTEEENDKGSLSPLQKSPTHASMATDFSIKLSGVNSPLINVPGYNIPAENVAKGLSGQTSTKKGGYNPITDNEMMISRTSSPATAIILGESSSSSNQSQRPEDIDLFWPENSGSGRELGETSDARQNQLVSQRRSMDEGLLVNLSQYEAERLANPNSNASPGPSPRTGFLAGILGSSARSNGARRSPDRSSSLLKSPDRPRLVGLLKSSDRGKGGSREGFKVGFKDVAEEDEDNNTIAIQTERRQPGFQFNLAPQPSGAIPLALTPSVQPAAGPGASAPAAAQPARDLPAGSAPPTPAGQPFRQEALGWEQRIVPDPSELRLRKKLGSAEKRDRGRAHSRTSGSEQLRKDLEMIDTTDDEEEEELKLGKKIWLQKVYDNVAERARMIWRELLDPSGPILEPSSDYVTRWTRLFVVTMIIAFAIDPLYFFVVAVDKAYFCIYVDWKYVWVLTLLRTLTDLCYLNHIILQFRLAYKEPMVPSNWFPWAAKKGPSSRAGQWIYEREAIRENYLRTWFMADLFGVIPLPQLIIFLTPLLGTGEPTAVTSLLRLAVLLQYVPRILRCTPLITGSQESGMLFESAWAGFLLNLVMYVMASHVVGAIWYLAAVQRYHECVFNTCMDEKESLGCSLRFLNCDRGIQSESVTFSDQSAWTAKTNTSENCVWSFNHEPDYYNYGIFNLALPLMFHHRFFIKYFYSLQWGFTAISTLGGGSPPSEHAGEVLFVFCITASGLFLFAVLIGNIQNFLQSLTRRTFEYQLHRRDMEIWMTRRNLPLPLVTRVKELERLMWAAYQGVDESEMLDSLTEDLQREVRRHLCLDLIKKSQLFSAMDDAVLDVIIERLRQRIYINGTVVIREGFPVSRMFFVLKGELESTTTGGGRPGFKNSVVLKNGDFFGEELLIAHLENSDEKVKAKERQRAYKRAQSSATFGPAVNDSAPEKTDSEILPKSERTIVCRGPVEGFDLEADDLEFVCKQFSSILGSDKVQQALNQCSHHRRTHAAITIQLWYRRHLQDKLGLSLAQVYLAVKQGRMGNMMKNALERAKRGKNSYHPIIISKR